jgi:8-oxo-dGTP diphosphatase
MEKPCSTVVAAIIERGGRVLICQRRSGDRYPLKWEFPGGKAEPGESPAAALERELEEELSIRARIGAEIARYEYQYGTRPPILLIFHLVRDFYGELENKAFEEFRWESPERLPAYDCLEGDIRLVTGLARGEYLLFRD